jgi:hypothetical protein
VRQCRAGGRSYGGGAGGAGWASVADWCGARVGSRHVEPAAARPHPAHISGPLSPPLASRVSSRGESRQSHSGRRLARAWPAAGAEGGRRFGGRLFADQSAGPCEAPQQSRRGRGGMATARVARPRPGCGGGARAEHTHWRAGDCAAEAVEAGVMVRLVWGERARLERARRHGSLVCGLWRWSGGRARSIWRAGPACPGHGWSNSGRTGEADWGLGASSWRGHLRPDTCAAAIAAVSPRSVSRCLRPSRGGGADCGSILLLAGVRGLC